MTDPDRPADTDDELSLEEYVDKLSDDFDWEYHD